MCPYARFQSAMFDRDTLIVTYDAARGDPRGTRARSADLRAARPRRLHRLHAVRAGVPDRHRHPRRPAVRMHRLRRLHRRLRRRDGQDEVPARADPLRDAERPGAAAVAAADVRAACCGRACWSTARCCWRSPRRSSSACRCARPLKVDVVRDRMTLARLVGEGRVENVYRLQLMNATEQPQRYRVTVQGLRRCRAGAGDRGRRRGRAGALGHRCGAGAAREPRRPPAQARTRSASRSGRSAAKSVSEKSTFVVPR